MRAAPLGVYSHRLPEEKVVEYARADSSLSHPNRSCCDAVAAYCLAIGKLVNGIDPVRVFQEVDAWARKDAVAEVQEWLHMAESNEKPAFYPQAGYVKIAFVESFRHLCLGTGYEDALRETLLGGGDTDTNACIVGGLLGAVVGAENLPQPMKQAVLECDTRQGQRPRPGFLHAREIRGGTEKIFKWAEENFYC